MILGFFLVRPIPLPPNEEEIPLDTRHPEDDSSRTPLLEDSGDNVSGDDEENGTGNDDNIPLFMTELLTFHLWTGQEDGDRNFTVTPSRVRGSSHTLATSSVLFPNVYGRRLWTSGDFWLLFTLLSLREPSPSYLI
jgi:hypothetical protein